MKKTVSLILVISLLSTLLLSFSLPVFSEGEKTKSLGLDVFKKDMWTIGGDVADITEKHAAGNTILTVNAKEDSRTVSVKAEFDPIDLSLYTEAVLRLAVRGEGEKYEVKVILYSGDADLQHVFTVTNEDATLYIPLSGDISLLDGIYISAKCENKPLSYMNLISLTADDTYTYSYEKLFSSYDIYSENSYERTAETFTVTAKGGEARVSLDLTDSLTDKENALVWVGIKASTTGGVQAETVDSEGNVYTSPQQTVSYNGTYSFLLKGGFESFSLRIFGLSDKEAKITLTGAGIYSVGEIQKSYGNISSCRYDGKKISVSGSLSQEATKEYNGSRLLLYAIPAAYAEAFETAEYKPIASSGFSTKFRISCELDWAYTEYFYKVVLDTEDGLLPVGSICAPAGGATTQSTIATHTVMYGADAADAFESNISTVIVDLFAGRLLENEDTYSAQIHNYNKKTYYFNKEYLKELDDRMQFYAAAGVEVYFRLYSDKDGYSFDYSADSADSISLMCAISGFISERYPTVKGYIMGVAANEHIASLTPEYAEAKARLLSVFCESVRAKNPTTQVIVPYSEEGAADPYLTCALMSHYLSKYRSGALAYMYEATKDISASYTAAAHLLSITAQFAASSNGAAVLWTAPATGSIEEITDGYRELCTHAQLVGLRFAALSVKKTEKSPALFDSVKAMLSTEKLIDTQIGNFEPEKTQKSFKGSYALWDFTSSYDTAGWVGGGSFSRPVTAKGEGTSRVMMAESSGAAEGAGILIGKTESTLDLSDVYAKVSFQVFSDAAKEADVTVIFGSGETRAEFSSKVECNKPISLLCDMTKFAGSESVDYASLIVRSDGTAGAKISKIELCSSTKTSEELKGRFDKAKADGHDPLLYIIIIFVIAATVTVFSILFKNQISKRKK